MQCFSQNHIIQIILSISKHFTRNTREQIIHVERDRSKKRIKRQNFCQTIEYLSFHRSGYLSNDRYMLFEMFKYQINCTVRKKRILVHVENSSYSQKLPFREDQGCLE